MADPVYDYFWMWLDIESESDEESDVESEELGDPEGVDVFVSLSTSDA